MSTDAWLEGGKVLLVLEHAARSWHRFAIHRIEDLGNAVLGAELETVQMAGPGLGGSLAFAAYDGIIFSSGLINGKVAVRGVLSLDAMTIGVGLKLGHGSRHWLNEVVDGDVAVFMPGDKHDAIYAYGSLYAAATLTPVRLEEEAARQGLVLDRRIFAKTGLHGTPIPSDGLAWMRKRFVTIHDPCALDDDEQVELGSALLRLVIAHYARVPVSAEAHDHPKGNSRFVHRAREYIERNLARAISMNELARVAGTSPRTLYRAFAEVLGDTPQNFMCRLRLHRIRRDLISAARSPSTISAIARSWHAGTDLGRLAGRYQKLFGESPSRTLCVHRARPPSNALL